MFFLWSPGHLGTGKLGVMRITVCSLMLILGGILGGKLGPQLHLLAKKLLGPFKGYLFLPGV